MIIDLTEWNEYIADDVPPGAIPLGVRIEIINISKAISIRHQPADGLPAMWIAEPQTCRYRTFWRELK